MGRRVNARHLVQAFWQAHGSAEALRKPAAVVLEYQVESLREGDTARFGEVAFRLDSYSWLWVRPEGSDRIERLELQGDLHWQSSPGIGCALATLRYLFSVPLATARGQWELRRLLAPSDIVHEEILEAAPLAPASAVGTCRLELEAESCLLSSLVYAPRHQFSQGQAREVKFDQYVTVAGVRIALRRQGDLFRETLANVRFLTLEEADERYPLP